MSTPPRYNNAIHTQYGKITQNTQLHTRTRMNLHTVKLAQCDKTKFREV